MDTAFHILNIIAWCAVVYLQLATMHINASMVQATLKLLNVSLESIKDLNQEKNDGTR